MSGCENTLKDLIAGISDAEALKAERDAAEEAMNENLRKLRWETALMGMSCGMAVITKSPLSILSCGRNTLLTKAAIRKFNDSLADFALKNDAFNKKVAENHKLFNKFCYCLSLGAEAIEYGNEFDALEEQLDELLEDVDDATEQDDIDTLEEEIEEVLEDLQHFDELLDELREEIEGEFG